MPDPTERDHDKTIAILRLRRTGTILFAIIVSMVLAHGSLVHIALNKQKIVAELSREIGDQRIALTLIGRAARSIVVSQNTRQLDPRLVAANVEAIQDLHRTISQRDLEIERIVETIPGLFISMRDIASSREAYRRIFRVFMDRTLSLASQADARHSPAFGLMTIPDLAIAPSGTLMTSLSALDASLSRETDRLHRITSNLNGISVAIILVLSLAITMLIFRPLADRARREFETVQQMSSVRTRYYYQMSHELRTPLNAIIGFGEMLKLKLQRSNDPGNLERVDSILMAGNTLAEKLGDIMLLTELATEQYEDKPETFDLAQAVADSVAMIQTVGIGVALVQPPETGKIPVRCDGAALDTIMRHLLHNALANACTQCTVEFRLQGPRATVLVSDDGPGIDLGDLERILEPFHTARNSAFETDSGLGIGLALVKALAGRNGIVLDFAHRQPQGTCVSLGFQIAEADTSGVVREAAALRLSALPKAGSGMLALAAVLATLASAPDTPLAAPHLALEVQHFWTSPSERTAIGVLSNAYVDRGGTWLNFTMHNAAESRLLAIQRIADGIPPSVVQWHAGHEIWQLERSGVIVDLTALSIADRWSDKLHPAVLSHIVQSGRVFSLPVGIHAENWAWYSSRLLQRFSAVAPDNWSGLLAILDRARGERVAGIAMGTEPWQRALLFNAVLISEGGEDTYRRLHETGDPEALESPAFLAALRLFIALRRYDARVPTVIRWQDATSMIANNTALVQFMGDWVLAELESRGHAVGRDFQCMLSTGRLRRHVSVVDAFVFPLRGRPGLEPERRTFAEVVLDKTVQVAFSRAKGAIPVRADLAGSITNPCIRQSYSLFARADASVPSAATIGNERATVAIAKAASLVWDSAEGGVALAQAMFRSALELSKR